MLRKAIATALVVSTMACGTAQEGDHTGALLGGLAAGAVGGAILGSALAQPRPAPVHAAPPPARVVYVQASPYDGQMFRLHGACDAGDRHSCIRFGILIGQHQERVAEWRRVHPDFFALTGSRLSPLIRERRARVRGGQHGETDACHRSLIEIRRTMRAFSS